ncbi:hypothetical protein AABB24_034252 [Solanum stoloniferum]|uniref:Transmembrane protein n=1 Tax=Solanum stoloniferum TaxID=62892 RepID=A0ABD2RF42_9SOLN
MGSGGFWGWDLMLNPMGSRRSSGVEKEEDGRSNGGFGYWLENMEFTGGFRWSLDNGSDDGLDLSWWWFCGRTVVIGGGWRERKLVVFGIWYGCCFHRKKWERGRVTAVSFHIAGTVMGWW